MMRYWTGAFAFLLVLLCSLPAASAGDASLRIAYPQFKPFHYIDQSGDLQGLFYEILNEALYTRMGVELVWTSYPWARCQENVRTEKDNAIITVPTSGQLQYASTHRYPFYQKPLHLFTYSGHPRLPEIGKISNISDIRDYGFSVITYSGNGWHKKHVESFGIKTYESSDLRNIWQMLGSRRGDLVIE